MTGDAFGSLLKILEEPPKDTMIILVAESSGKLPKTIVSRSQIINCMHPSHKESMRWLMAREDNDWDPVLSIFGNRPLLIDEMGSEYLENQINALSSEITGLIEGEIKPSEISWKNEDIEINLRILYSWIFKYLEIRLLQGNVDQNLPIGLSRMLNKNVNNSIYNVGVGNQPHSEISALAILLDRIQDGEQFEKTFANAKRKIIPTKNGKNVQVNETRD